MFIIACWKIGRRSVVVLFLRYLLSRATTTGKKKQQLLFMASFESLYFILTLFLPLTLEIADVLNTFSHSIKNACAFVNAQKFLPEAKTKWKINELHKRTHTHKKWINSRAKFFVLTTVIVCRIWKLIAHIHYQRIPFMLKIIFKHLRIFMKIQKSQTKKNQ